MTQYQQQMYLSHSVYLSLEYSKMVNYGVPNNAQYEELEDQLDIVFVSPNILPMLYKCQVKCFMLVTRFA